jgi:phage/plasmid-like protein (TIGR03299 family)
MVADIYKDRFVGVEPAWHRIGTAIEPGTGSQAAMAAAGMTDWNVRCIPLEIPGVDGKGLYVIVRNEDGGAIVASETMVEGGYVPISNEEIFRDIVELMAGHGLPVDAAGVLGRLGNRAFMTFDAGRTEMPGNEEYERYIVAIANHTGRDSALLLRTGIRVVCRNTEEAAKRTSRSIVTIPHNRAAIDRFYENAQDGRMVLGMVAEYDKNLERLSAALQSYPFDAVQWKAMIDRWTVLQPEPSTMRKADNIERAREKLLDAWLVESRNAEKLGQPYVSLWTARQAISTYALHLSRGSQRQHDMRQMRIATGQTVPVMETLNGLLAEQVSKSPRLAGAGVWLR